MAKMTRYQRNIEMQGLEIQAQEKLLGAKVLVMGAGGLGSGVIMNLAALGVGQIKIIDDGIVQEEDLNRQLIHKYKNIGRAKVISAKDWIAEYNSDIKVELDKTKINDLNYFNVIQGYDIIVDCFGGFEEKFMLNEIAVRHKKILVHGSAQGFRGQVTTIVPDKTGCLECVMQKPLVFKKQTPAKLSPVVSLVAALQAQEVLKIVTGCAAPLLNRMLIYDGLKGEFSTVAFAKDPSCKQCSEREYNVQL